MSYRSYFGNYFCSSLIVRCHCTGDTFFRYKCPNSELKDTSSKVTFILVQPDNTISNRMYSLAHSANNKRFSISGS